MQDVADARITFHGTVRTLLPTTMVWDLLVGKTYRKGETTNDTQPKGLSPTGYPFFGWTYTKESNVLYWAPSTKISPYKGANTGH